MIDNVDIQTIFQEAIQRLIFAPCISLLELKTSSIEMELGINQHYNTLEYREKLYENERAHKRYDNLLKRLVTVECANKSATELLALPKRYDEKVRERQIELYNYAAAGIGFQKITNILSNSFIKKAAYLDEESPDKKVLARLFPYYNDDERIGVNFIEYIILGNIYLTTHSRSLFILNKAITTKNDRDRAEQWIAKVSDNMADPKMYKFYINAFFDIFYDVLIPEHLTAAEAYIRTAWLPEHYKYRKDAFIAAEKHRKYQLDRMGDKNTPELMFALQKMDAVNNLEFLQYRIIPLVGNLMIFDWKKAIGSNKNTSFDYSDVSDQERITANDYKNLIGSFIDQAIKEAQNVLAVFLQSP